MVDKPVGGARVRRMTSADLEAVLSWRNHPEVRRYMYTQHEISTQEHAAWFERTNADAQSHLLIFELAQIPAGFISFKEHARGAIGDWGFYLAPEAPRGTGYQLGLEALEHGFIALGFHKVCGQVLAYNERSIAFHERLGFQAEGVLREQHFDGLQYHNIVCFGILAKEWLSRKEGM